MGIFCSVCYAASNSKPVDEKECDMRKPALKIGLLIAFVILTAVSCDIFINTGESTAEEIRGTWQLISINGVPWTLDYQVYTFNKGTITEFLGGSYAGQGSFAVNGDTVVINNNFNSIDLNTGNYDASFRHNYMYLDGYYGAPYYVFYRLQ
jgi:hypothetical protein